MIINENGVIIKDESIVENPPDDEIEKIVSRKSKSKNQSHRNSVSIKKHISKIK